MFYGKNKNNEKAKRFGRNLIKQKSKVYRGNDFAKWHRNCVARIFHILAGSSAGATFLPMHIAVLIAASVFGALSASIVAGSSVVFSYLLTGMPTLARLPYMLIELVIYAVLLSIFNKKCNTYIALIATITFGRILYSGVLFVAMNILGLPTYGISVLQSIQTGLPGIVMQLICVPFIAKMIKNKISLGD